MRLFRAAWSVFASSCLIAVCASACGSSTASHVGPPSASAGTSNGTGATGTGAGATGTTNGGGPNLGNLGGADSSSDGGQPVVDNQCAGTLIQAQRIPLDMYVMLDVSGSMLEATQSDAKVTKWQAVSSALTDFVSDPASDGMGVGLQVFPIPNTVAPATCTSDKQCAAFGPCLNRACWPPINQIADACLDDSNCALSQSCTVVGECSKDPTYGCDSLQTATCGNLGACTPPASVCVGATDCKTATYANPAAAIAALPGAKAGIVKVIQASTPVDGALTPTGPALSGAIQEAKTWAMAHPDHQVVAVLATDGQPTLKTSAMSCAVVTQAADIAAVVNLATQGKGGAPSISTFVIGVIGPNDAGAPATLNAIAMAGNGGSAFIVNTTGNVQMQFRDALNKIRASGLACDLAIPAPPDGMKLDYDKVNVQFSGDPMLAKVDGVAQCDATKGGWYYDKDPTVEAPTRILTCPVTCDALKSTDMGSVQVELGCKTRVVVK